MIFSLVVSFFSQFSSALFFTFCSASALNWCNRHGKTAVAIIVTFLLASWIVSALVSLHYNYTHKVAEPLESFGYLYEKPWTRLGPYVMGKFHLILLYLTSFVIWILVCRALVTFYLLQSNAGMLAGYVLNRFKSPPAAITPFINIVFWLMSMGVMLLLVFGVWNGTLSLLWTALYVSLGHSGEFHFCI